MPSKQSRTLSFPAGAAVSTMAPIPRQERKASMSILLVAGSPSERSRSAALLDAVSQRLAGHGPIVERLHIRDLSPQALLLGDAAHRSIAHAVDQLARARAVVI